MKVILLRLESSIDQLIWWLLHLIFKFDMHQAMLQAFQYMVIITNQRHWNHQKTVPFPLHCALDIVYCFKRCRGLYVLLHPAILVLLKSSLIALKSRWKRSLQKIGFAGHVNVQTSIGGKNAENAKSHLPTQARPTLLLLGRGSVTLGLETGSVISVGPTILLTGYHVSNAGQPEIIYFMAPRLGTITRMFIISVIIFLLKGLKASQSADGTVETGFVSALTAMHTIMLRECDAISAKY